MSNKRAKTISKNFYDDEIQYKDPETGEIHLKAGVHRQHYNTHQKPDELESHINYWEAGMRKLQTKIAESRGVDNIEYEQ